MEFKLSPDATDSQNCAGLNIEHDWLLNAAFWISIALPSEYY